MKRLLVTWCVLLVGSGGTAWAQPELLYTFDSGAEGFQNVVWRPSAPGGWTGGATIQQNHTAGGWQNFLTKEFSWGPGGGAANQQLTMQALANYGALARISFDVMIDGGSFPPDISGWFQLTIVGNSDGAAGWTQRANQFTPAGWHNANDSQLITMHIDQPFSWLGWEPGDTWFQLWTGANSPENMPVNFYFDNVRLYVVPEPSLLAYLALGWAVALLRRRG
ncbi:MAG: hypothetical protein RMN51_02530 [Verrucomicrobiota bacterium]|nr:hypothetical protein [Limisphaera sp.]MDW8380973.1 hypothetical protein [Verrucomicrobiota bacterium]